MDKRMDYALEKSMDDAIITLSLAFAKSGKNEKPVILHSIRVGMCLFNYGYCYDVVISGLLHDILEDTEYSAGKLAGQYGETAAGIVKAVSFDRQIADKIERNEDMFKRCRSNGKNALLVKCADLIDNMPYVQFVDSSNAALKQELEAKYLSFFKYADMIKNEPIFQEYSEMFSRYFRAT